MQMNSFEDSTRIFYVVLLSGMRLYDTASVKRHAELWCKQVCEPFFSRVYANLLMIRACESCLYVHV